MVMPYTEEQQKIIAHDEGNALINAVAGSGKTTVMVGFIEKLAKSGIDPKKVMVLMFNRTARDDFQERLIKKLKDSDTPFDKDRLAEIRTLSSLSYKTITLLQSSNAIEEYTLLFGDDRIQNALCRDALKACDVNATPANVDYLKEVIDWIKARHDDIPHYQGMEKCKEIELFTAYEALRHKRKLRFSSDWAYDTVTAVKSSPDLLYDVLNSRFQYVIVDEFQDINACQMEIINVFVNEQTKILVVGDVNQSIYAWRGSDPNIMLKDFPNKYKPVVYNLSQTFRFGQTLSDASNRLIAHNPSRFEFECFSAQGTPDTKVNIINYEHYQPHVLAKDLSDSNNYSQVAILGRERAHWFETELNFLKHNIPYQVMTTDGQCVLETLTIKSLLGYLRLASSAKAFYQMDKEARKSLISQMMSMPSLYLDRDYKVQLINRLTDNPDSYQIFPEIKRQIRTSLKIDDKQLKAQCDAIDAREEIWDVCLGLNADKSSAYRALRLLYTCRELNIKYSIQRTSLRDKDAEYKLMLVDGLIDLADHVKDTHPSIDAFLSYIDGLHTSYKNQTKEERAKCVTITTMHRSKGLEWDHVILPDLHDGAMPVVSDKNTVVDEEGDRRLLYVAMTRAKHSVYLVGGDEDKKKSSVFLGEMS